MDAKFLLAYSLSSIGLLTLIHRVLKYFKRQQQYRKFFRNKVVLITGASSGLGAGLAEELYPLGAQLILCARRLDELNKVKESLMKLKISGAKEPEVLCLDVSSPVETYKSKLDILIVKHGCINILINNAGISYRGETISTNEDVFHKIMDVNFFGAVRLTNYLVKYMIQENEKTKNRTAYKPEYCIVNIGSVQSILSIPYRSAYAASKHALLAYTDALRSELHQHRNINAMNVYPGYINTNISMNALRDTGDTNKENDDDHRYAYSPNYVAKRIINSILNHDKEVFISVFLHRLAVWIRFFLPNFYHYLMSRRAVSKINANQKYLNRLIKINRLLIHNNKNIFINYGKISINSKRLQSTIPPTSSNLVGDTLNLKLDLPVSGITTQQYTDTGNALSDAPIIQTVADILAYLHDTFEIEWWAIIPLAALAMRLFVAVPTGVFQTRNRANILNLQEVVKKEVQNKIGPIKKTVLTTQENAYLKKQVIYIREGVYQRENVSPIKNGVASCLQFPFWLSLSVSLRDLCGGVNGHIAESIQLKTEGFLWLKDLTQSDPYFIVPTLVAIANYSNIKYISLQPKDIKQIRSLVMIRYPIVALIVYSSSVLPCAVGYFWFLSTIISLIENILFDSPRVKRFLRVPKTKYDQSRPYLFKYNLLKDNYQEKRRTFNLFISLFKK